MVDLGGNFNGYMNDMSRVFSIGKLPEEAYTAHQVCLDIQEKLLPLPDRVLPVKCFTTQQSKWSKQPDLPTNLWEQDNKPNLSVTASGLKLTKLRYWLPA